MVFRWISSAGEDAREPAGQRGLLHSRGFWRLPLFLDGNAVKVAPETDAIQRTVSAASFCCPRFSTFSSPDGECVIPFAVGELHYRLSLIPYCLLPTAYCLPPHY
ncbi:MAG: hypothetical protein IJH67_06505 [Thermoguttaceae bacterium]|nr:hypothetical protein [Thermoguttaceae bacterium]